MKPRMSFRRRTHAATAAENSEVLFFGLVAVAVRARVPTGGSGPWKAKATTPAVFVVTVRDPRYTWPDGPLASLAKNSIVNVVSGVLKREPETTIPDESVSTVLRTGAA